MIFTTAPHYLCLDCGGTKTAAALVSPTGDVVARGYAGPSNFKDIGLEAFIQSVKLASSSALATATGAPVTLPPPTPLIAAVWVGASGIDSGADIKILTPILSELFGIPAGKRLIISNDSHLLASPLRLYKDISNALVTIAGTGTVVVSFGTREDGGLQEVARAGGWGWMLGDEGSAYHVGREAIRQILQEFNQQALSDCPLPPRSTISKPTLRERILDHYSLSSPDELFAVVYATEPNPLTSPPVSGSTKKQQPYLAQERKFRLSGLSPLIFSSAFDDGDEMALAVLRKCTDALAESACGLLRHPDSPITKGREKAILASETVLCLGGSLVGVPKYRDMYLEAFKKQGHVFGHVQFVEDAAEGGARALWSMFAA